MFKRLKLGGLFSSPSLFLVKILKSIRCGDIAVIYYSDAASGRVELQLVPASKLADARRVRRRAYLGGSPEIDGLPEGWKPIRAYAAESLVQAKLAGDPYPGAFAAGLTMRDGATVEKLRLVGQELRREAGRLVVTTSLRTPDDVRFEHVLTWRKGEPAVVVRTRCLNDSGESVTLEMLASFSLGGLSPFAADDAPGRLVVHRYRSFWSAEGRRESLPIEALHLERSWTGHAQIVERFGQVGSMPVRKFFPFAAVEDTVAGVTWAAQLATPGSWQMEFSRRGDALGLSGGLADREFGHWTKTLAPGETFESPEAILTVVAGDVDEAGRRLTGRQAAVMNVLAHEEELPIVFNEWCSSWGNPTHDSLVALADKLRGTPVKYLVIDDGWSKRPGNAPQFNGDWILDTKKFPHGLAATCAAIRERGLIPGIWFEFETCSRGTQAWEMTEHHLHRDGRVLEIGSRRFWDFRDPWVHDYLREKVIELIRANGIGYLKIDYNDTIGLGCDGAESLGEGLRAHLEGVQAFLRRIRGELPDLVIENCSSGGHRLEPSMQALASMGSFSDAHETVEIPIIAANLHPLILPRQSQIWAVLRKEDSYRRLEYSLAATFLGRMALSGDILALSPARWKLVREATALYREVAPIIRDGVSVRHGPSVSSYRHPEGWQTVVRRSANGGELLVVSHRFGGKQDGTWSVELPAGAWKVAARFGAGSERIARGRLGVALSHPFSAQVLWLRRSGSRA
jgi:Alpha-galactosidase